MRSAGKLGSLAGTRAARAAPSGHVTGVRIQGFLDNAFWWLASIALFAGLWELAWAFGWANPMLLPPPHIFLHNFLAQGKFFDPNVRMSDASPGVIALTVATTVAYSTLRVLTGLALGFAMSVAVGMAIRYTPLFGKLVMPTVLLLAPVSPVAWMPVALFVFGIGNAPAIFLVVIALFFIMTLATVIDYRRLRDWALFFFGVTTILLIAVTILARSRNGTRAWFVIGPFQLQPSELAKVTLILVLAAFVASDRGEDLPFPGFVRALGLMALPVIIVIAQPDLGTASVFVAITMAILLVAKANPRHIALVTGLAVFSAVLVVATGTLESYQFARLTTFVSSDSRPNDEATEAPDERTIDLTRGRDVGPDHVGVLACRAVRVVHGADDTAPPGGGPRPHAKPSSHAAPSPC